jgi:hypothetical protein
LKLYSTKFHLIILVKLEERFDELPTPFRLLDLFPKPLLLLLPDGLGDQLIGPVHGRCNHVLLDPEGSRNYLKGCGVNVRSLDLVNFLIYQYFSAEPQKGGIKT